MVGGTSILAREKPDRLRQTGVSWLRQGYKNVTIQIIGYVLEILKIGWLRVGHAKT